MKRLFFVLLTIFSYTVQADVFFVYPRTKEAFYNLFHTHYHEYSLDIGENINWLEQATRVGFSNPRYALANIETREQWEKYKKLFNMHIYLKLTEMYLKAGDKFNKENAYFFDEPFRNINLEGLSRAETIWNFAKEYWKKAREYSSDAYKSGEFIFLDEIQFWHDENYRIEHGELDYNAIIDKHLQKLELVRQKFKNMEKFTGK